MDGAMVLILRFGVIIASDFVKSSQVEELDILLLSRPLRGEVFLIYLTNSSMSQFSSSLAIPWLLDQVSYYSQ